MGHWDVFLHLSSGWKGCHIRLLVQHEQERVQGFWILSTIVSDDRFFYALKVYIKFVVDTSGWHTALTGNTWMTPIAMIGGPSIRSRSMAQNCAFGDNSRYVWRIVCATTSCMLSMCSNDYVLHACSAPSYLKARSCVDTMLVHASSLAKHTIELAAAQKIYSMVAKVNGGQFNNHSNSIRHL